MQSKFVSQLIDPAAVLEASPHPYILLAPDLTVIGANKVLLENVGKKEADILGRNVFDAFEDESGVTDAGARKMVEASLQRAIATLKPDTVNMVRYSVRSETPAGPLFEDRFWSVVNTPILDADGKLSAIVQTPTEVTELHSLKQLFASIGGDGGGVREALASDEARMKNGRWLRALESAGDGVWDWNVVTDEMRFSTRWKAILGYDAAEIPDAGDEWLSRVHPDDASRVREELRAGLEGKPFSSEHRMLCKDGAWKWVVVRAVLVEQDDGGKPLHISGTMSDITERKQSEEMIWRHASFDSLTGLPNRRLFRDRLEQEIRKARRTKRDVALFFIDLDRFKEVNDLLGHDAGDLLLSQAARRLVGCVRATDTVARLGGDEFTVILTNLGDKTHVEKVAKKIIAALGDPFHLNGEIAYISGSIGITFYAEDAADPEALIRNADQAMYAAKSAGRNQFRYFTRSMQEEALMRSRLGGELRSALAAQQLQVHYQPVVDLATGRIVKAEALLRWQHPRLGLVNPAQFIPLAEESGLINEIGDWVFKQAAGCSQRWGEKTGKPFEISVNRSPVQFLSRSDSLSWPRFLADLGLPANSISVEITEDMLLNASPNVADTLLKYRDAGMHVALDDFGTGYSSMAFLKKFDIDYLKIDKSFVRDIAVDESSRNIAESIIAMAHKLGLKVIAEGVETEEQEDILTAAGCDFGQGYLFSKALPAKAFEKLLL